MRATLESTTLIKTTMNKNEQQKIMVVEDDKFLADLIIQKLRAKGYDVSFVSNGESVMSEVEKVMPDLILLDILLPGVDGFDVLGKLKSEEKLQNIKVVILSNLQSKENIHQGKTLGAESFLIKSLVDLDEIVTEVEKVLNK